MVHHGRPQIQLNGLQSTAPSSLQATYPRLSQQHRGQPAAGVQAKDHGAQDTTALAVAVLVDIGVVSLVPYFNLRSRHDLTDIIGPNGPGPWGSSNYGPYSDWSTRSDWRDGPWTAWWGGSACPPSDWPGWTAGPWSSSAPWTSWSGCTAKTTATNVATTTVSGSVVTTTAYGLQVAAASGNVAAASSAAAAPMVTAGLGAAVGAAVLGMAVGL
jgi:hypothetical protein